MRVLVACEFSGVVREAFRSLGHDAWSCDMLPSEQPGNHIQGDALEAIAGSRWDLLIAHPPCTYLCNSGVCWLKRPGRKELAVKASEFFRMCLEANVPKVAVENPTPHGYARGLIGKDYTQVIQPYWFGHTQSKRTCLWLRGLPPLVATNNVYEEMMKLPLKERQPLWWGGSRSSKLRSKTFTGIANAMAEQWGGTIGPSIIG